MEIPYILSKSSVQVIREEGKKFLWDGEDYGTGYYEDNFEKEIITQVSECKSIAIEDERI